MRAVIAAWGGSGDVMPAIGVAAALQSRGHDCTVVANACFESRTCPAGLDFVAVGTEADHERLKADPAVFGRPRRTWEEIYAVHYYRWMDDFHGAVAAIADRGPVDVVIGSEVGAAAFAELHRIPRVRLAASPAQFASRRDPPHPEMVLPPALRWMARGPRRMALFNRFNYLRHGLVRRPTPRRARSRQHPVSQFRARVGLPATDSARAQLIIGMWPPWFVAPQPDWPDQVVLAAFSFYPRSATASRGDRMRPVPAARPVVATTGSMAGGQRAFYETVVAACRALGRRAILVTPHRDDIPPGLPPDFEHLTYAPFGELFDGAALVIHHGGIGTGAYGLAAGVPQLVAPMRGNQFDNGNRLARLGVASLVALDPSRPDRLARAIGSMLQSRRVAASCRHWQSRIDLEIGLRGAAEHIEALVRDPAGTGRSRP